VSDRCADLRIRVTADLLHRPRGRVQAGGEIIGCGDCGLAELRIVGRVGVLLQRGHERGDLGGRRLAGVGVTDRLLQLIETVEQRLVARR